MLLSNSERDQLTTALAAGRAGTKLEAVLVADQDGQVLVEAPDMTISEPELVAALRALAARIAAQTAELTNKADYETHFFDWDGRQVIGKRFEAGSRTWLLVALCPPKAYYKQAFTRVIKAVEAVLKIDVPSVKVKRPARRPKSTSAIGQK